MNTTTEPTEQGPQPGRKAIPLNEAAQIEGAAPDALRMRYRRGKLAGYRDSEGRIFIYADELKSDRTHQPNATTEQDRTQTEPPGLIEELRRQLERLERRESELLADLRAERDRAASERERSDILLRHSQEQAARAVALLPAPGEQRPNEVTNPTERAPAGQPLAVSLESAGPTLSTAQAAQALGRSPRTLLSWAARENAPLRPLGLPGPHRWSTAEVLRLVRGEAA